MKRFPVLSSGRPKDFPKDVPWSLLEGHEKQALSNHSQSLTRLAQRGGLCPIEMLAVIQDREYPWGGDHAAKLADAVATLLPLIAAEEAKYGQPGQAG